MSISILMSCYKNDNPLFLKESILSIGPRQELKPNEIILIVDGPIPEKTHQIILNLKKRINYLKVFKIKKNVGLGNALNYGLKKTNFKYIARMDSDDISLPSRLKDQYNHMINKKSDISGTFIEEFDENSNYRSIRKVPVHKHQIKKWLPNKSPFNHMSVMFKKSKIIQVGGYQHLYYKEDVSLWIRLLFNNIDIKASNLDKVLVKARFNWDTLLRRRGFRYLLSEFRLIVIYFKLKKNIKFIPLFYFLFITLPSRLSPPFILKFLYKISRS